MDLDTRDCEHWGNDSVELSRNTICGHDGKVMLDMHALHVHLATFCMQ